MTNVSTVKKIIVVSLAILLVVLIVALIVNLVKLGAVNNRRDKLAEQSAMLDRVIDENGKVLDYCGSPEFVEDYARYYLDMVKRGEIIIEVK